jgi:NAD(P)-dependent dehydrogenase (short-subunit alcohol dehydrogenase family)
MLLKEKVYVITGAASQRSIDYAKAELLADHRAKVVVVDLVMDEKMVADIKTSIEGRLQRAVSVQGLRCDISVADSASIVRTQSLLDIACKELDVMLDVNFKDAFYQCQSVLKNLVGRSRATPAGHRRSHSLKGAPQRLGRRLSTSTA